MRRLLLLGSLLLLLAACAGGGVRERVNPPSLSLQELTLQQDGRWALKLRLQNFSNVSMRIDSVDAQLRIGEADAGALKFEPRLMVAPGAEVIDFTLTPATAAATAVKDALISRRGLAYSIEGTIRSSEPDGRRDEFTHQSQLSAVPGLTGVMR